MRAMVYRGPYKVRVEEKEMPRIEHPGDAIVRVRFLAEFRSRSKGPEGEAVDDRRTAEIWTFERNVTSRDPNWALAKVEPAEV